MVVKLKYTNTVMNSQFLQSLVAGIFVGGAAGYLGSLMVTKKMALAGDALGHVALPGMGLALLMGLDVSLGAFLSLIVGIVLIWLFGLKTSLPMETLVGIVFVASLALGFLLIPQFELIEALVGDISNVSFAMVAASAVISVAVFFVLLRIYPGMMLINISEDLAEVQGIKAKTHNFIYLLLIALIVSLGVKITGSLLVGSLLIIPAATARNLSRNLNQYSLGSIFMGILSCVIGALVFRYSKIAAGPAIIMTSTTFFLLSLLLKKR